MTTPTNPTEDWVRSKVRAIRKAVQYDTKVRNADGVKVDACSLEEELVRMVLRQQAVPHDMTRPDGFPSGGGTGRRGTAENTTTEAAALYLEPAAYEPGDPEPKPPHPDLDVLDALLGPTLDYLDQAARSLAIVGIRADEHRRTSKPKPTIGHSVAMCPTVGGAPDDDGNVPTPVPCGEIAEPGRRLCRGCRDRLQRFNARREEQGLDRLRDLPKHEADALFAERAKRRAYDSGPFAEGAA